MEHVKDLIFFCDLAVETLCNGKRLSLSAAQNKLEAARNSDVSSLVLDESLYPGIIEDLIDQQDKARTLLECQDTTLCSSLPAIIESMKQTCEEIRNVPVAFAIFEENSGAIGFVLHENTPSKRVSLVKFCELNSQQSTKLLIKCKRNLDSLQAELVHLDNQDEKYYSVSAIVATSKSEDINQLQESHDTVILGHEHTNKTKPTAKASRIVDHSEQSYQNQKMLKKREIELERQELEKLKNDLKEKLKISEFGRPVQKENTADGANTPRTDNVVNCEINNENPRRFGSAEHKRLRSQQPRPLSSRSAGSSNRNRIRLDIPSSHQTFSANYTSRTSQEVVNIKSIGESLFPPTACMSPVEQTRMAHKPFVEIDENFNPLKDKLSPHWGPGPPTVPISGTYSPGKSLDLCIDQNLLRSSSEPVSTYTARHSVRNLDSVSNAGPDSPTQNDGLFGDTGGNRKSHFEGGMRGNQVFQLTNRRTPPMGLPPKGTSTVDTTPGGSEKVISPKYKVQQTSPALPRAADNVSVGGRSRYSVLSAIDNLFEASDDLEAFSTMPEDTKSALLPSPTKDEHFADTHPRIGRKDGADTTTTTKQRPVWQKLQDDVHSILNPLTNDPPGTSDGTTSTVSPSDSATSDGFSVSQRCNENSGGSLVGSVGRTEDDTLTPNNGEKAQWNDSLLEFAAFENNFANMKPWKSQFTQYGDELRQCAQRIRESLVQEDQDDTTSKNSKGAGKAQVTLADANELIKSTRVYAASLDSVADMDNVNPENFIPLGTANDFVPDPAKTHGDHEISEVPEIDQPDRHERTFAENNKGTNKANLHQSLQLVHPSITSPPIPPGNTSAGLVEDEPTFRLRNRIHSHEYKLEQEHREAMKLKDDQRLSIAKDTLRQILEDLDPENTKEQVPLGIRATNEKEELSNTLDLDDSQQLFATTQGIAIHIGQDDVDEVKRKEEKLMRIRRRKHAEAIKRQIERAKRRAERKLSKTGTPQPVDDKLKSRNQTHRWASRVEQQSAIRSPQETNAHNLSLALPAAQPTGPLSLPTPEQNISSSKPQLTSRSWMNNHLDSSSAPLAMKRPSNRKVLANALIHVCLAGPHFKHLREQVLKVLKNASVNHFAILFRKEVSLKFRGLYAVNDKTLVLTKLHGSGPMVLEDVAILRCFKYNTGQKAFQELSTHSMTKTTDAFTLDPEFVKRYKQQQRQNHQR